MENIHSVITIIDSLLEDVSPSKIFYVGESLQNPHKVVNKWDAYSQFIERATTYMINGHDVDKIELIILGGSGIGMIAASIADELGNYEVCGFLNDVVPVGTQIGKYTFQKKKILRLFRKEM